jgi:uncharacterized protein (DUF1501 family)
MSSSKIRLMTRREFLTNGIGIVAVSATIPSFLGRTAILMGSPIENSVISSKHDDPILVVIQLSGGNDGLNTVIPFANDRYYAARPTLAIPKDKALKINDEIALHPSLQGMKALYDSGKLAIIQGVGYPNPDRSHFRSMEIWQSGVAESFETNGWIGRMFDHTCNNEHSNEKCSPTCAVSIGETLNPALQGLSSIGVSLRDPEQFFRMTQVYSKSAASTEEKKMSAQVGSELDYLRRTAMNAELSADKIRKSVRSVQSQTDYPKEPFAQGLKLISSMIAGGMDTRVYYISLTGFDTHANQPGTHERLLKTLSDGIASFQKDIEALGQAERVVGFTFSEFGRRVAENGSRGTDHGQAAPMFAFGKKIKPGIIGSHPSLEKLSNGDVSFQTDFRQIYAAVLQNWLKVDSKVILGQAFQPVPILG